jgi:predicted Fe-Mo cluster-binding NifX family protein
MICQDDSGEVAFEQNTGHSGRSVVEILQRHGCTDAVFTEIGPGALRHLQEAGIRGWFAPADAPVSQLLSRLRGAQLTAAEHATEGSGCAGRSERKGTGCGEAHRTGNGRALGCCQQRHQHGGEADITGECTHKRNCGQKTTEILT